MGFVWTEKEKHPRIQKSSFFLPGYVHPRVIPSCVHLMNTSLNWHIVKTIYKQIKSSDQRSVSRNPVGQRNDCHEQTAHSNMNMIFSSLIRGRIKRARAIIPLIKPFYRNFTHSHLLHSNKKIIFKLRLKISIEYDRLGIFFINLFYFIGVVSWLMAKIFISKRIILVMANISITFIFLFSGYEP